MPVIKTPGETVNNFLGAEKWCDELCAYFLHVRIGLYFCIRSIMVCKIESMVSKSRHLCLIEGAQTPMGLKKDSLFIMFYF